MSRREKLAKCCKSQRKLLETGSLPTKYQQSEPPPTNDARTLTAFSEQDTTELSPSTQESLATNNENTSNDKSATSKISIRKPKSLKTSGVDSTSKEKHCLPFWDKSCQEISQQLWLDTKTDSQGLVATSSNGSASKTIANSWFSVETSCLVNEKWLNISLPSSTSLVAESTPGVNTNLLSKKIRVYPETKLAAKWRTWIAASRWCYNQAIAILKTEKIGKYDLRKKIMDSAPIWVSEQPYNPRQMAVFQAFEAHKAAKKSKGIAKFRSRFDRSQTIRFQVSNWKSGTFYPQATKGLSFKVSEPIADVMEHEPTLSLINGQWFICYAVDTAKPLQNESSLAIALDPGVRTFLTGFDGSDILEVGKNDIGRIYRLARHLDKLMSRIWLHKGGQFKRLRYCLRKSATQIRIQIKNLVNELHKKAAKYLVTKYKIIFLPTFETQQMVKKGKRKLATKTARTLVTLSHYRFKQMLKHQASKSGCIVVDVTEEYTSKTCSKCGHIHTKLGGSKKFKCPECGHTLDRDVNGAFNILLKALRDTSLTGELAAFSILPYTVSLGLVLDLPG
jgi:putative transposase